MRTLVVYPYGHLSQTPCAQVASEIAAQLGDATLLCLENEKVNSVDDEWKFQVLPYSSVVSGIREGFHKIALGFYLFFVRKLISYKPDVVLLVGERALPLSIIAWLFRRKVVFLSLELYFPEDFKRHRCVYSTYRALVRFFASFFDVVLIQDRARAKLFSVLYGVPMNKIGTFPNIPLYTIRSGCKKVTLKNPIGLTNVLYSGSLFAPWGGLGELIRTVKDDPYPYTLVLHSRIDAGIEIEKNKKIYLSKPNLSLAEYDDLVRSCDIGLAVYFTNVSRNIKYVGLSSGKILHYLSMGKPVIVNSIPYWREVVMKHGLGMVVNDLSEIGEAVKIIEDNYKSYCENVFSFYSDISNRCADSIKKRFEE